MSANLHDLKMTKRDVRPTSIAMNVLQYSSLNMPDYDPSLSDQEIYDQLTKTFKLVEDYTRKSFDGQIRSLIIPGPAGIGKTTPLEQLKEQEDPDDAQSIILSGYVRAPFLFRTMYKYRHPGCLIALDDSDNVWHDMLLLNLMKKGTDTTKERWVVYGSDYKLEDEETGEPIPKHFLFEGNFMFLTNMNLDAAKKNAKLAPHVQAMESRSFVIDMQITTKRHLLLTIFYYANRKGLFDRFGLSKEEYKPILTFIEKNMNNLRELSLRTAVKCAQLVQIDKENWEDMARLTLFR